jgi:hypothetical protein
VVLAAVVLYERFLIAPECVSDDVQFAVSEKLSPKFLDGTLIIRKHSYGKMGKGASYWLTVSVRWTRPLCLWGAWTQSRHGRGLPIDLSVELRRVGGDVNVERTYCRALDRQVDKSAGRHG